MDQNMTFSENIDTLFSNLQDFTKNESVLGTPVTFEGKTLVPVISVTLGYGSGNNPSKNQQGNTQGVTAGMMQGMGALGLGAKINTEAIVLIDKDKDSVTMLPVSGKGAANMIDKLPQMLSSLNMGGQQSQSQMQNQQGQQNQQ